MRKHSLRPLRLGGKQNLAVGEKSGSHLKRARSSFLPSDGKKMEYAACRPAPLPSPAPLPVCSWWGWQLSSPCLSSLLSPSPCLPTQMSSPGGQQCPQCSALGSQAEEHLSSAPLPWPCGSTPLHALLAVYMTLLTCQITTCHPKEPEPPRADGQLVYPRCLDQGSAGFAG